MKNFLLYLKLIGFVSLYPFLSIVGVILVGLFSKNISDLEIRIYTVLTFFVCASVFWKNIKPAQTFKIVSPKKVLSLIVLVIALYIFVGFIQLFGKDLTKIEMTDFPAYRYLFALILYPFFEELCCRIVIFNHFLGKINQWILILVTALFFGFIHAGGAENIAGAVIIGIIFARLYTISGNGSLLVIAHIFYNLLFLVSNGILFSITRSAYNYFFSAYHYIAVGLSIVLILTLVFYKPERLWKQN